MIELKIYEVVYTKEMLRGELIENMYAVYEETECKIYKKEDGNLVEKNCRIQKHLTIFKGNSYSSLIRIKTYQIEDEKIKDLREMIMKDFPALFKDRLYSRRAV